MSADMAKMGVNDISGNTSQVGYYPSPMTVKENTTIIWHNVDTSPHTVTSGDRVNGPSGIFDSQILEPNGVFSVRFNKTNTYHYFDTINPEINGTVIVNNNVTQVKGAPENKIHNSLPNITRLFK